eukprot:gene31534-42044_t
MCPVVCPRVPDMKDYCPTTKGFVSFSLCVVKQLALALQAATRPDLKNALLQLFDYFLLAPDTRRSVRPQSSGIVAIPPNNNLALTGKCPASKGTGA